MRVILFSFFLLLVISCDQDTDVNSLNSVDYLIKIDSYDDYRQGKYDDIEHIEGNLNISYCPRVFDILPNLKTVGGRIYVGDSMTRELHLPKLESAENLSIYNADSITIVNLSDNVTLRNVILNGIDYLSEADWIDRIDSLESVSLRRVGNVSGINLSGHDRLNSVSLVDCEDISEFRLVDSSNSGVEHLFVNGNEKLSDLVISDITSFEKLYINASHCKIDLIGVETIGVGGIVLELTDCVVSGLNSIEHINDDFWLSLKSSTLADGFKDDLSIARGLFLILLEENELDFDSFSFTDNHNPAAISICTDFLIVEDLCVFYGFSKSHPDKISIKEFNGGSYNGFLITDTCE